ncbi:hypothetical protein DAQ1742_01917 [Dickeya aquatica]|uniref:Uncharacterized protein n=2 Tax=Pectobacteriaceae TaxID=1903410 RepID=A0A375AA34_9GAMM|nr:hypothetical protein DAQ1742_01917 [Dickeya aquatica]
MVTTGLAFYRRWSHWLMLSKKLTPLSHQEKKRESELLEELYNNVNAQINAQMDIVRARTYWHNRLPEIELRILAEALTYALHQAAIRTGNKNS